MAFHRLRLLGDALDCRKTTLGSLQSLLGLGQSLFGIPDPLQCRAGIGVLGHGISLGVIHFQLPRFDCPKTCLSRAARCFRRLHAALCLRSEAARLRELATRPCLEERQELVLQAVFEYADLILAGPLPDGLRNCSGMAGSASRGQIFLAGHLEKEGFHRPFIVGAVGHTIGVDVDRRDLRDHLPGRWVDEARKAADEFAAQLFRFPGPDVRLRGNSFEEVGCCLSRGHRSGIARGADHGNRKPESIGFEPVPTREEQLAEAFIALSDTLVRDFDVTDFLYMLTETCTDLLGADQGGVLITDGNGDLTVTATTSHSSEALEILELDGDVGPCLDCYESGETVLVPQLNSDEARERWPEFTSRALEKGFRSMVAVPLTLRDQTIGALDLFMVAGDPLSERDKRAVQALADIATVGILHARELADAREIRDQLQVALDSRVTIEQAKGMIAQDLEITNYQAFKVLRRYARENNLRLKSVAEQITQRELIPEDLT